MERRAASHTEEEEMNQRRRLLNLARKGDPKAVSKLFELYQVRIYSGDMLNKLNRAVSAQGTHAKSPQRKSGKSAGRSRPPAAKPSRKTTRKAVGRKRRR